MPFFEGISNKPIFFLAIHVTIAEIEVIDGNPELLATIVSNWPLHPVFASQLK